MLNRVFKAFRYRDFRLMWFGACTSTIGSWMQIVAQAWLVYTLSNDPFYLGLDAFLGQAPIVLFSLVGGVIADRRDRRTMLLMSQYIQMSCAFLLTALFYFHAVHVWQILALSFVTGTAQSFGGPAYAALLPTLVGSEEEDYSNAIAWNSIQFNLARIIGPTLAGVTLAKLNATWCFGLNGISFTAVIISLYVIKTGFVPARTTAPILSSMKQGIGFIRTKAGLDSLIVLAFCMTLFASPLLTFLPVFAKEVFRGDATTFTRLLICSGAGSVCGALIVAGGKSRRQGRIALMALILLGGLIAAFSVSKSMVVSSVLIFFSGGALISVFAMIQSLVQVITADEMRGRVLSVYNVAFRGGMPIGSLLLGKLIPVFTVSKTMAGSGLVLTALGLYFLLIHRRIAAL
ncbi:MAG TPA: MFS transporter [Bryobacteraceae bacterium]|nr:MFS transporter [Bryobacteraceae bacterium]